MVVTNGVRPCLDPLFLFSLQMFKHIEQESALPLLEDTEEDRPSVSFKEEVQLIPPNLKSTTASREAGKSPFVIILLSIFITYLEFELDSDDLDNESLRQLENDHFPTHAVDEDQRMPLLIGLFASSASRRSQDDPLLPLRGVNGNDNTVIIGDHTFDLDELAAKRTSGGGLVDSIANMANSILGAGMFLERFKFIACFIFSRYNW